LANSKDLAGKVTVRAVMLMKKEALNIAFGEAVRLPPHPWLVLHHRLSWSC
jgi:hypothetical protein